MRITLVKSNLEAQLTGTPAITSFKLTAAQLRAWNTFRNTAHLEDRNSDWGLPCAEACNWLRSTFGVRPITLTDVKAALN